MSLASTERFCMLLRPPFAISSRLLPSVTVGGASISIEITGSTSAGRTKYRWYLDLPDGGEFTGNDLRSGCQGGSIEEGMSSLLCFMAACGEAYRYSMGGRESENIDLFPEGMREWCYQNSDELTALEEEIRCAVEE